MSMIKAVGQEEESKLEVPSSVEELLSKYQTIFEQPMELPPPRFRDHQIVLKEGVTLTNMRPYRYPYALKNDGSWWFCVEYRALNEVTVGLVSNTYH